MSYAVLAVLLPLFAAFALAFAGQPLAGARANIVVCGLVFLLTTIVGWAPGLNLIHADGLGAIFGVLTGFIALTTAVGNLGFVRGALAGMSVRRWRLHHALCQIMLGMTLLGLYADNILLLWVALLGATVAAALGAGLPRTAAAPRAAWKVLVIGGVGTAVALFGTLLLYLAALPALGPDAMSFIALGQNAARLDPSLMALAFIFLLLGYAAPATLAPLHAWTADAAAEGPAPLTATLAGVIPNVALIAILRFRHLDQASVAGHGAIPQGTFLIVLGAASLLLAGLSLTRRRDTRRFFALASIESASLTAFAFGIGGGAAIFAGLLQVILHTLTRAGLFQLLTQSALLRGGAFSFAGLRGMAATNRWLGWVLGGCVFGLAGLPPSALFVPTYLIVSQTALRAPWLLLPLGLGLIVFTVGTLRAIVPLVFGPAPAGAAPRRVGPVILPAALCLVLALLIGFAMPGSLLATLSVAAAALQ